MKTKLTSLQADVVHAMKNGYELTHDTFADVVFCQEGLIGHGGKTFTVNKNTFNALVNRGIIVYSETTSFKLNL